MSSAQLRIAVGQCSDKGRKPANQDFHGACVPTEPLLTSKGCAVALADGISSSDVSRIASESAIGGFLEDYYSTPAPWSVKTSGQRVLMAINSWLYSQTRKSRYRYDADRGYVCTLSAIVFKSATAHVFHVGDGRVYRLAGDTLERLTEDHRIWITHDRSHLRSALGADEHVEIDYCALRVEAGDRFLLVTDGIYEYVDARCMAGLIRDGGNDVDSAARALVGEAHARGSPDNLTALVVLVEALPEPAVGSLRADLARLPFPPALSARTSLDGYRIVRELHASNRSHVYLAVDEDTGARVAVKTLSTEMQLDPNHVERFLTEEWIARRVDSPNVAKAHPPTRPRNFLYTVMEFVDGRTLRQWMVDNPEPDLATVRGIVEQIAQGLRALHRLEMIHQDLRPDNVMIDTTDTVRLIDFGSARVAGIADGDASGGDRWPLGTTQYSAPEYLLGERGTTRSDIFSLGVVAYEMLTGHLPYGVQAGRARSRADQFRLKYRSVLNFNRTVPMWIDGPLRMALHPDPNKRYAALSELVFDLRHGIRGAAESRSAPLIERNPVLFWQLVSSALAIAVVALALAAVW